mmetsp:Transcript_16354/g.32495  ORF Transcript_16354/g.32495 Transcript_16354/m.32495 type:complete len:92 (+) Transcript_16354:534-809(+)
MPREYIVRLVMDTRHKSLGLLRGAATENLMPPAVGAGNPPGTGGWAKIGGEVIVEICYRPYPAKRFAKIAFCAVSAAHQVKGYGIKRIIHR